MKNDEPATSSIGRPPSSGPLWFPSERRGKATHFKSWRDFLYARKGGNRPATIYYVAKEATTRVGAEKLKGGSWEKLSVEIPWMTFVLGSGCLMTPDVARVVGGDEDLRARLERDLKEYSNEFPGLGLGDLVATFIEAVARDRTGRKDKASVGADGLAAAYINIRPGMEPSEYPSVVALSAALATRIYAAALASTTHVVGSASREEVRLDMRSWWGASVAAELLEPYRRVLGRLSSTDEGQSRSQQALAALAERMLGRLRNGGVDDHAQPTILRTHVELLTAFAWYFLTEGTTVYPGWSDLLLFQSFEDKEWYANEADNPNARPRLEDVISQDAWVYDRIVRVTNASWKLRSQGSGDRTKRASFYDLIADFLHQQAAAIGDGTMPRGHGAPPPPVCFVSSFDLELEMALWQKGKPFIVVMPVFAGEAKRPSSASLHWVWARIVPTDSTSQPDSPVTESTVDGASRWLDEGHEGLILPPALVHPARWQVLKGETSPGLWRGLPAVVRVTGSPLMDPPVTAALKPTKESDAIHHALLLDEYTAIQQAALDFSSQPNSGLPAWLTHNKGTCAPRFWMLLGTQVADTGIRLRLMAQLMAAKLSTFGDRDSGGAAARGPVSDTSSDSTDAATPTPEVELGAQQRMGMLLNDKSGTNDRELFLWNDLDVVDGTYLDRIGDLTALHQQLAQDFDSIARAKRAAESESEQAEGGDEA